MCAQWDCVVNKERVDTGTVDTPVRRQRVPQGLIATSFARGRNRHLSVMRCRQVSNHSDRAARAPTSRRVHACARSCRRDTRPAQIGFGSLRIGRASVLHPLLHNRKCAAIIDTPTRAQLVLYCPRSHWLATLSAL